MCACNLNVLFTCALDCAAECGKSGNVMSLWVCAQGDLVLVGDLMMSLNVLRFNSVDSKLEDVAGKRPQILSIGLTHVVICPTERLFTCVLTCAVYCLS